MSDHLSRPRMDRRLAARVERKKAELDRYRPLPQDTVRRLNDDLRVFLTYHSNAIEGNSLMLQETQMVIDYGITIHGHPLREYLEATNHAEAYQYVTALVEKRESITCETIRALHALVMDKILETKGRFRTSPVYIHGSNMTPPRAREVERLMREWVMWVYGEGLEYEPVMRAAIAHHGFEACSPPKKPDGTYPPGFLHHPIYIATRYPRYAASLHSASTMLNARVTTTLPPSHFATFHVPGITP